MIREGGIAMSTHLLDVHVEGLKNFANNEFYVDFRNEKRVNEFELEEHVVTRLSGTNYRNNLMVFAGINASGKTTALRLLDYILNVFISGESLNNDHDILDFFTDEILMKLHFITNSKEVFEIEAKIVKEESIFFFVEEVVKVKKIHNHESKKTLLDFKEYDEKFVRTLFESSKLQFLKLDDSIFPAVRTDEKAYKTEYVINTFKTTEFNYLAMSSSLDGDFIKYLDNSIEEFSTLKTNRKEIDYIPMFKIKFYNEKAIESSLLELQKYLSSGTIKALGVLNQVAIVLKNGGYLIIDEIENHLNKIIVQNIMEIFQSELNYNGATLIFSTHYSEILDRVNRKDSIQILQRESGKSTVKRLSTLAAAYKKDRTDIKNSDLILSGIFGTAPSYTSYKKVRQVFKKEMGLN